MSLSRGSITSNPSRPTCIYEISISYQYGWYGWISHIGYIYLMSTTLKKNWDLKVDFFFHMNRPYMRSNKYGIVVIKLEKIYVYLYSIFI